MHDSRCTNDWCKASRCIRGVNGRVRGKRGQWIKCNWTDSPNVCLHSHFVPSNHSCGRCRIEWEQLFYSPFSGYSHWHCLHSGDGQRRMLSSLARVCSLRVGTEKSSDQCSNSILGMGREGCDRRCQKERDWWQDITCSWSQLHRIHGAINDFEWGGCC